MPATSPRPDLAAHERATRAEFADVARDLRELLGAHLVAYLGGVRRLAPYDQWADGDRMPGEEVNSGCGSRCGSRSPIAAADSPRDRAGVVSGPQPAARMTARPARLLQRRRTRRGRAGDRRRRARAFLIGG